MVFCRKCNKEHEIAIPPSDDKVPTQGVGCAAAIFILNNQWVLQAFYGSKFDTDRYKFIKNIPSEKMDPICDECILSLIKSNDLIQLEGRFI